LIEMSYGEPLKPDLKMLRRCFALGGMMGAIYICGYAVEMALKARFC
jgi:hypothetical protein